MAAVGDAVPAGISALNSINEWYETHKANFSPPVCNKLMHKGQLSIMFVGGPNTRKDFHLEEGSEFFFQLRGDMELPTIQNGKRVLVRIRQGQVFALPSRIPHSPQRPMENSLGLVVERERQEGEMDGLIFFKDFEQPDQVQWEQFFRCNDLGRDLPPVIGAYREWVTKDDGEKNTDFPEDARPIKQNRDTEVPPPFFVEDFLTENKERLEAGETLPLFGEAHPDRETLALVLGGPSEQAEDLSQGDTWLYQLRGSATVKMEGGTLELAEGSCCIVDPGMPFSVSRPAGSVGMLVRQDPMGNKTSE